MHGYIARIYALVAQACIYAHVCRFAGLTFLQHPIMAKVMADIMEKLANKDWEKSLEREVSYGEEKCRRRASGRLRAGVLVALYPP